MMEQNGLDFAGAISEFTVLIKALHILFQILLNFIPNGLIDIKSALVQVMVWRTSDKPLHEHVETQFTET